MTRKLAGLLVLALVASGCAASQAFRHGQDAARVSDWDTAIKFFTKAVQENPDNGEYRIHLRRAQDEAYHDHTEHARELERRDDLEAALVEYRKALEITSTDRVVEAKVSELERKIRERVEATRERPRIEQLQQQARPANAPPLLNPASREPLRMNFGQQASLRDILNFIGTASGININYDQQFQEKSYGPVNLDGVTLEEALNQVLSANQYYYKVTGPRTIIVIPDQPAKHQQYDDLVMRVFYINHADATELSQLVNSLMRIPQMPVPPMVMPNKTANTITVRATAPVMDVTERLIRANDRPRAEVLLDIQILEVNNARVKKYGIDLSQYALNLIFSPEVAPPNAGGGAVSAPPPFNLNTISQGVSTNDFYLGVPYAVVNFLEQDSQSRTLAKPQLRGSEGQQMTLNLGQDIPVLQTVFGAAAAGGLATTPTSSYSYRTVGVILDITPAVTYEGEVRLKISVESSALGSDVNVGGQSAPSFTSRKVTTYLRLREGEANLLAGLIRQDKTKSRRGVPGLGHIPGINAVFTQNDVNDQDNDIVMLITPHIVRDHELSKEDVSNIYIGTQGNIGLSGPPALIAAQPEAAAPPAPAAAPGGQPLPGNVPQTGAQGPPVAARPGNQNPNPAAPPGTAAVPSYVQTPTAPPTLPPTATGQATPSVPAAGAAIPTQTTLPPVGALPPTTSPAAAGAAPAGANTPPAGVNTPPAGANAPMPAATPSAANPSAVTPPAATDAAAGRGTNASTPAQIIVTAPGTEFRVGGGPYTVPITINNATRMSTLTLTITYNPAVLRVRTATEGTFMRQGNVTASFAPKIDGSTGRVDLVISRANDQTGASGAGVIAALMFDAVVPGTSTIGISGVALGPNGSPVPITSSPVTVTVR
jgi:general secretion pathway protein D